MFHTSSLDLISTLIKFSSTNFTELLRGTPLSLGCPSDPWKLGEAWSIRIVESCSSGCVTALGLALGSPHDSQLSTLQTSVFSSIQWGLSFPLHLQRWWRGWMGTFLEKGIVLGESVMSYLRWHFQNWKKVFPCSNFPVLCCSHLGL